VSVAYDGLREGKQVEFRILGPVQLWADGKQYDFGSRKERCALAVLLWERGRPVRIETLIDRVWGDDPPEKVLTSLYSCLSRLRNQMREASGNVRGDRLTRSGSSGAYVLDAAIDEVDFRIFRELSNKAKAASADGDFEQAVTLFQEAESLWRGTPLAGLSGTWADGVRMRLEEERLEATIDRLDAELHLGRHASLVGELFDLAAQHPLNQEPTRLLMLALHGSGRQPDASRVYLAFRRRLLDEDGSDPTPELDDLYQQMLSAAPGLGVEPRARKPKSPDATPPVAPPTWAARTLPRDNPDFTGRAPELSTLMSWMNSGERQSTVPVIAISGMAGVGKTTLAVHAAHLLGSQYSHQIHLELRAHNPDAPPLDAATALGTALRALGVSGDKLPADTDDRAAMWRSRAREVLVVLDDALNSDQVRPLLPSAPGCAVLITSRLRSLDLPGMLALPLATLPPADAVALFVKIAGADQANDPAAIASVLGLCGHLPIEIQLAASLLRRHRPAWAIEDLIARLQEVRAEDRSLTASLELSYRYLIPEHQRLLRRLALHPDGNFSGYAGAALAGCPWPWATERGIEALADYHLIDEPTRGHFAFHALIRQYALHIAQALDPEQDRQYAIRLLLDYYVRLAEHADMVVHPFHRRMAVPDGLTSDSDAAAPGNVAAPLLLPPLRTRQDGQKWLECERANLLHAARYASKCGFPQHAGLLPHLLGRFLDAWGDWADAIDLHRMSADAWRAVGNASGEARALADLGYALCQTGRYDEAIRHTQDALAIARRAASQADEADALNTLGVILRRQARYPDALACHDDALTIWHSLGNRHGEAETLHRSAIALCRLRRVDDALRHAEQALTIYRELGDPQGEAAALNNLSGMQQESGWYEQALGNYHQVLTMFREIGDRQGEAIALSNIGDICRHTGHQDEAIRHYRTALDKFRNLGDRRSQAEALIGMSTAFQQAGDGAAAIDTFQKALVIAHELAEKYLQVLAYLGLGKAFMDSEDYGSAAADFRTAIELSQQIADPDSEARGRHGLREATRHLS
jgi:DNA-binding SARP family transcriptional activator/tetratricopeptide (TPR) repeat protein